MEVVAIDDVGKTLMDLKLMYQSGHIQGMVIGVLGTDGIAQTTHVGRIGYLQVLGLAEQIKQDVQLETLLNGETD